MRFVDAKYTCPRCGSKQIRKVQDSAFGGRIVAQFNCPKCDIPLKMTYSMEFQAFKSIARVMYIEEYLHEIPSYYPRKKKRKKK